MGKGEDSVIESNLNMPAEYVRVELVYAGAYPSRWPGHP
jgi:hypothetical protein